ncbi:class I SAM-dependent methyltransferase [Aurantiacibacter spongiae]|uniref:Class I SAM-dependent methyltransferase n=1 Tax=Aurantiacibacter spongiae TaxID=2488860 RepID=A0A3N5CV13_9SPHN|nr:class I SAM-dependent methyltransferase [Aurantiacibacter spongiae]RPF72587.1 class I SAM-dependent methyltransferase [Aurantiacibacter spongiae]
MGLQRWYDETILPRLVTLACSHDDIADLRREVVPHARGRVLEIGVGGGLNQPFYNSEAITSFAGIDPNPTLLGAARRRAGANGWTSDIRGGRAEDIPFPDGGFDTVVCTFTLCSVDDHAGALAEMRRVLDPAGRLLFLEHGRAPDPALQRWQDRIEPVWKRLAGNCHLTREIGPALRRAGFEVEPLGRTYLEGAPRWAGWVEWGAARRAGV